MSDQDHDADADLPVAIHGHPKWQDLPSLSGNFRHLTARQRAFLVAYVEFANVSAAARCAQVNRDMHYHWMGTSEAYGVAFKIADEMATDKVVHEAHRLAIEGVEEKTIDANGSVKIKRRHATDIFLRILEARDTRFARRVEHRGVIGHVHVLTVDDKILAMMTDQELSAVEAATMIVEAAASRVKEQAPKALAAPTAPLADDDADRAEP